MAIFGSYIDKERSLLGESVNVILLDSFVAIMAGLIIFPSCAAYGVEVTAGPALLFDTMAAVFKHIQGGRIWGTLFFMFMTFAGIFDCTCGVREYSGMCEGADRLDKKEGKPCVCRGCVHSCNYNGVRLQRI